MTSSVVGDKLRIIICGNKKISQMCLDFLKKRKDVEIVLWVRDSSTRAVMDLIKNKNPDYIFSLQHEYLIPQEVIEIPKIDCINLHFGLLPRYGGCYPITHGILNGEDYGGFTFHKVNPEFDKGPIIYKKEVLIKNLVASEAYQKITMEAYQFFGSIFPKFADGSYKYYPQEQDRDFNNSNYYKKTSINFERDSVILPEMSGEEIIRRFRAFMFPKYQFPKIQINNSLVDIHNIIEIPFSYSEDFIRNITTSSAVYDYDTYVFENIEGKRFLTWVN